MTNSVTTVHEEVLDEIEPLTHLQTDLQRAAMPPNDYLIHGRAREQRVFNTLARRVDKSLRKALNSAFSTRERSLLLATARRWRQIKQLSREILAAPNPVGNAALAAKMESLDTEIDTAVITLDQAHDLADHEVTRQLAAAERTELEATTFVAIAFIAGFAAAVLIALSMARSATERCFGYSSRELVGQDIELLMPARFRGAHNEGMARYLSNGLSRVIGAQTELVAMKKDGTEFPIELSVAAWQLDGEKYFTGMVQDITERKEAERLLKHLSVTDSLTGLFNHAEFYRRLADELERSRRYGTPVAVLMLDIDRF